MSITDLSKGIVGLVVAPDRQKRGVWLPLLATERNSRPQRDPVGPRSGPDHADVVPASSGGFQRLGRGQTLIVAVEAKTQQPGLRWRRCLYFCALTLQHSGCLGQPWLVRG